MKIKHKLSLIFTLLLSLPVTAVVFVTLLWATANVETRAINNVKSALELGTLHLASELSNISETIDIYAQTREVKSLDPEQFLPFLRREIARKAPQYEKFVIGLPNGYTYNTSGGNSKQGWLRTLDDSAPDSPPYSLLDRDYWQATIGNNSENKIVYFVSQPMISYSTGARQVMIARTLLDEEGKVAALLGTTFEWGRIEQLINDIRDQYFSHFDWPARLMLVDRNGNYWYHWNPNKIVQHLTNEMGQPVFDARGQAISVISSLREENIPALNALFTRPIPNGVQLTQFQTPQSKDDLLFIHSTIASSGYMLGVVVSKSELLQPLTQLKHNYLWLLALVMLFSSLAGVIVARSFSQPMEQLTYAAQAFSKGEKSPLKITSGSDEIRQLSLSFCDMRDIIFHREAELARSESRLNYAFQGANDGLWDWDLATNEVFYSPRWFSMLGYCASDFDQNITTYFSLLKPESNDIVNRELDAYLSGQHQTFRIKVQLRHRDGHYVHVLSRAFAVFDFSTGKAIRLVGTHVDISEQVAFEQKIQSLNDDLESRVMHRTLDLEVAKEAALKAQTQAEQASRSKSRFLANMSHELRTPLNSIIGFSERLIDRLQSSIEPRHMEALLAIQRNGRQLLAIINDVLDTQRIAGGDIILCINYVMIPELFDQLMRSFQEQAASKNISLSCSVGGDINHRSVQADPVRLRQILSNLISNALKFTHTGSVHFSAEPETRRRRLGMRFDVKDTGQGLYLDDTEDLFTAFTQGDESITRAHAGTGLGLTLVKQLTELHQGAVSVESTLGQGSTFSIWIPAEKS